MVVYSQSVKCKVRIVRNKYVCFHLVSMFDLVKVFTKQNAMIRLHR